MNSAFFRDLRGLRAFRDCLLRWYDANRRDLPWRQTQEPYRIWVSEIMLQQTRVAAVLEYYRAFLRKFPDVHSLARAREQSVLAAWSGLGYYRRARNLHACAKVVSSEHGGLFPSSAAELQELPGIGRYTAAAIASIAFGEPIAVVDGNVQRVLQRVTGRTDLSEREAWDFAQELLGRNRPGDFNQSMMELGATVCLPKEPRCLVCPVLQHCVARGSRAREKKQVRKTRVLCVAWSQRNGSVWLVRRPKTASLMPGMWELPEMAANGHEPLAKFKHSILDTDYLVSVCGAAETAGKGCWVSESRLSRVALTGLSRKILRHFALL